MSKEKTILMMFVVSVSVSVAIFAMGLNIMGAFSKPLPDKPPVVQIDAETSFEGLYYPSYGSISNYRGEFSLEDLSIAITQEIKALQKQADRQEVILDYFLKEQGIEIKRLEGGKLQLVKDDCIVYEEESNGLIEAN